MIDNDAIEPREVGRELRLPFLNNRQGPGESADITGDGNGVISERKPPIDGDPVAEFGERELWKELERERAAAEARVLEGTGMDFALFVDEDMATTSV